METIKKSIIALLLFTFTLTATLPVQAANTSEVHWGLGYEEPGGTPVGNASAEYLAGFNACYYGDTKDNPKTIYLTFDAGYENGYTEKILDSLKENNVPAAFFVLGSYISRNPDIIKRMVNEGHIVCNHTMSHDNMSAKDKESFILELKQVEEVYSATVGSEMKKYYRPPAGVFSERNLEIAKGLGYKTILWSVAYADWDVKNQPSKEKAFATIMPRLHPGAILLLHSTSATNTSILSELIAKCRELGYEFKSLDNL